MNSIVGNGQNSLSRSGFCSLVFCMMHFIKKRFDAKLFPGSAVFTLVDPGLQRSELGFAGPQKPAIVDTTSSPVL